MNSTVETRVVELQFDNSQFERNVQNSLNTLDELNKSLDLEGAEKGARNLRDAFASNASGSVTSSLAQVQTSFSALEVAGIRVIQNLTDTVVNFGKNIISKYIVAPISQGFSKYGEKNTAMRTTLNAVKERYETEAEATEAVTNSVEKLMWFSDETSYSFTEMLSNISKFTAAGGDLEKSTDVMIGISNAAALAGQNSSSAARAMYNLAQAYGTGSVKLIDWKSVENANIATSKLKQTVIDSAVELGRLQKKGEQVFAGKNEVTTGTFNSTLATGWFDKEVMEKAFGEYAKFTNALFEESQKTGMTATELLNTIEDVKSGSADAKEVETISSMIKNLGIEATDTKSELDILTESIGAVSFKAAQEARTFGDAMDAIMDVISTGWMDVSEKVFGDVDESAKIWTTFANEVSSALWEIPGRLAEILSKWRELEGHTAIFNAIGNIWEGLKSILGAISDAFGEVFGGLDDAGAALANFSKKIERFTEILKPSETALNVFKTILKAVFGTIKLGVTVIKAAGALIIPAIVKAVEIAQSLAVVLAAFFKKVIAGVQNLVSKIKVVISPLVSKVVDVFKTVVGFIKSTISNVAAIWTKVLTAVRNAIASFVERVKPIFERLKAFVQGIPTFFSNLWIKSVEFVKSIFSNFGQSVSVVFERVKIVFTTVAEKFSSTWGIAIEKVKLAIKSIIATVKPIAEKIKSIFISVANKIKSVFQVVASKVKEVFSSFKLGGAGGNAAAAPTQAVGFFGKLKELIHKVSEFSKTVTADLTPIKGAIDLIGNLIGSIKGKNGSRTLGEAATGAVDNMGGMFESISNFMKAKTKGVKANNFLKIAASIAAICFGLIKAIDAIKEIASMEPADILKGVAGISAILVAIGGILLIFNAISKRSGDGKMNLGLMVGIIAIASATKNVASSLKELKEMSFEDIKNAIIGLGSILAVMATVVVIASKFAKFKTGVTFNPVAFTSLASALVTIVPSFITLGSLSLEQIALGTLAMISILGSITAVLVVASKSMNGIKGSFVVPAAFSAIANTVVSVAPIFVNLSSLSPAQIIQGSAAMALILTEMAATLIVTTKMVSVKNFAGVYAMTTGFSAIGNALAQVGPVFISLSELSLSAIIKGSAAMLLILAEMTAVFIVCSKLSRFSLGAFAIGPAFSGIANAVSAVVPAFETLGSMSVKDILKGSVALTTIITVMAGAMLLLSNFAGVFGSLVLYTVSGAFSSMATAINSLVDSLSKLAQIDTNSISAGSKAAIEAVVDILSELFGNLKLPRPKKVSAFSEAISSVASAVADIVPSFKELSSLKSADIEMGASALKAILNELSESVSSTSNLGNMLSNRTVENSEAYVNVAKAITDIVEPFKQLSKLKPDSIERGSNVISAILNSMATSLNSMHTSTVFKGSSFADIAEGLSGAAESIGDIADPFAKLGKMSPTQLDKASSAMDVILDALAKAVESVANRTNRLFSGNLAETGTAYKDVAEAVKDIADPFKKLSGISDKKAASACETLNTILDGISKSLVSTFKGTESSWFSKKESIADIGSAYKDVATSVQDISDPFIKLAKLNAKQADTGSAVLNAILSGMSSSLVTTKDASATGWFENKESFVDIGTAYVSVAKSVQDICDPFIKLSKLNVTQADTGSTVLNAILSGMSASLVTTKDASATGWFENKETFADIGTAYVSVATAVQTIQEPFSKLAKLKASDAGTASSVLNAILSGMSDSLTNTKEASATGWFTQKETFVDIGSAYASVATAVQTIQEPFTKLAGLKEQDVKDGCTAVNAILQGLSDSLSITFDNLTSSWFEKTEDPASIGDAYVNLATSIEKIATPFESLAGIGVEKATDGCSVLSAILKGISENLVDTSEGTTTPFFMVSQNIEEIGAAFTSVADAITKVVEPFERLCKLNESGDVDKGTEAYQTIVDSMSTALGSGSNWDALWGNGAADVGKGFNDFANSLAVVTDLFENGGRFTEASDNIKSANLAGFAEELTKVASPLERLSALGISLDAYGTSSIQGFTTAFGSLVDTLSTLALTDNAKSAIETLGSLSDSLEKLKSAEGADSTVVSDLNEVLDTVKTIKANGVGKKVKDNLSDIADGIGLVVGAASGESVTNGLSSITSLITSLTSGFDTSGLTSITTALESITGSPDEQKNLGKDFIANLIAGIKDGGGDLKTAVSVICSKMSPVARSYRSVLFADGIHVMEGFINGISSQKKAVADKLREVCQEAALTAEISLKIHSPSRVFAKIGEFVDLGFAKGIDDNSKSVTDSVENLCGGATALADILASDLSDGLTITPVVDLSNVESSSRQISSLLSYNKALGVSSAVNAEKVSSQINAKAATEMPSNTSTGATYTFTQNNYSPKALSRADIYRQTKNQFTAMKGLVGNV